MPRGAAALLQQPAADRETRLFEVEVRCELAHACLIEQFRVNAVDAHGVATTRIGIALRIGVKQIEHTALADHDVVVEFLLQPLPELHGQLIERHIAGLAIDLAGIAEAGLKAWAGLPVEHGDLMPGLGEIIGRRQAMAAAADDDHVIGGLRRGVAPHRLPIPMPRQGLRCEIEDGVAHGRQQSRVVSRSQVVR